MLFFFTHYTVWLLCARWNLCSSIFFSLYTYFVQQIICRLFNNSGWNMHTWQNLMHKFYYSLLFYLWNPKEQAPTPTSLNCSWQQHLRNRGRRRMACLIHWENLKCFRQDSVLRSTPQIPTPALCPSLTPVSNATENHHGHAEAELYWITPI